MELKNLKVSYKNNIIFDNLNMTFEEVGITFLKGDSGTGKSTLLNVLYGIKAYKGEYIIEEEVTKFRRNYMSYIFQDYKVEPNLTVLENIVLHLNIKNIEVDYKHIDELLNMCYILHNKHKKAKFLSGGEKQRLAIVRALITKPSVLLCDEPTGNLDEETSFEIFEILKEISKTKLVIVASHSNILIEKFGDRIYKVENNDLVQIKYQPTEKLVYQKNEYGIITFFETVKLAFRNYRDNFMKINFIFVIFAIFASLFLVLNFSKSSFDDFLDEKYQEFPGKDSFVVDILGYSSLEELDEFISEHNFQNYIIDTVYNQEFITGLNLGLNKRSYWRRKEYTYKSASNFRYYPSYKYETDVDDFGNEIPFKELSFANRFAVKDLNLLDEYLIGGRTPENNFEFLINENALYGIIDEYNQLLIDNDKADQVITFETLDNKNITEFLNDNPIYIGYNDVKNFFDAADVYSYKFLVVGVIDDSSFKFDNYPYNLDQKHSITHRKHNRNIYVSIDYLLKQFQLTTFNYKGITDEMRWNEYYDPNLNQWVTGFKISDFLEEEIDVYKKELFKTVMIFDQNININNYVERIEQLSDLSRIDDVKLTEFYYEISEDINNQDNINKYIRNYSIYILTIGFLTSFIAFLRFSMKRKDEYLIYELLGMEEEQKKRLFKTELLFIAADVSILILIFYYIFTSLLADVIGRTISGLIYKTRDFVVTYSFNILPVIVLVLIMIPFFMIYNVYKRKLVK